MLFLLCIILVMATVYGFSTPRVTMQSKAYSTTSLSAKPTLTDETTWKLSFSLNGVPTMLGKKVDELFVVEAQFLEEEGYEPPQGSVRQLTPEQADDSDPVRRLKITKGSWKLSEDPDDRKDGLWIWGLFQEPLYPFLLLQLETDSLSLPGEDNDSIKPLKLFAQITHIRDKDSGEVSLKGATLNVREMETVKADPFGGATVEIYEEIPVGQLRVEPVSANAAV